MDYYKFDDTPVLGSICNWGGVSGCVCVCVCFWNGLSKQGPNKNLQGLLQSNCRPKKRCFSLLIDQKCQNFRVGLFILY